LKDLAKIDKVFKDSGLKNTNNLFNQEQRDQLEDLKFLEKHGYKRDLNTGKWNWFDYMKLF